MGVAQAFRPSLTFCTLGRSEWFTSQDIVDVVSAQILRCAVDMQMEDIAHCFMPDHVHLLVEGCTEGADCLAFVHQAKQRSGYAFSQRWGCRLWQPSFYDHVLRDEESVLPFAKYILENPVRAGLVQKVEDYPFVGSARYTVKELLEGVVWRR